MKIDGIDYYFYEVKHPIYTILLAENANEACKNYMKYVSDKEWLHVLMNIREVSREHVKDKFESNKRMSFDDVVKLTTSSNDKIVLSYSESTLNGGIT